MLNGLHHYFYYLMYGTGILYQEGKKPQQQQKNHACLSDALSNIGIVLQ